METLTMYFFIAKFVHTSVSCYSIAVNFGISSISLTCLKKEIKNSRMEMKMKRKKDIMHNLSGENNSSKSNVGLNSPRTNLNRATKKRSSAHGSTSTVVILLLNGHGELIF